MIDRMAPPAFTAEIFERVRSHGPDAAQDWLDVYVSAGHIDPTHYRVTQAQAQIEDARQQLDRFSSAVANSHESLEIVRCKPFESDIRRGVPPFIDASSPAGEYATSRISIRTTDFTATEHLPLDAQQVLNANDFFQLPPERIADRVFVANDVRLSASGGSDASLVAGENTFFPSRSSRNARLTGNCLCQKTTKSQQLALILPFPYSPNNYYHSLTEMAFGLRFAHLVPSSTPIVYDFDPFGLLPPICRALKIDPERLIPRSELQDTRFDTAVLPDVGPYYWGSDFRTFFRSIAVRHASRENADSLYISRRKSRRSMTVEADIEELLRNNGFEVVYAEELTFEDQMAMFSKAKRIVAAHGAGMTNVVFAPSDCKVVEIFQSSLPVRDFQMRLKFVTPHYYPLLMDDKKPQSTLHALEGLLAGDLRSQC